MPFFKKPKPATETTPNKFDNRAADELVKAIRQKRKLVIRYNKAKWAKEFSRLRRLDKITPKRIKAAVEWYAENLSDRYTPRAYTAAEFRKKFLRIEDAMERKAPVPTTASKNAVKWAKEFKAWGWPMGAENDLPIAVGITERNFNTFRLKLRAFAKAPPGGRDNRKAARYADYLLGMHFRTARSFSERWFRDAFRRVRDWPQWNGDIIRLAFDYNGKQFQIWAQGQAREYGNPKAWKIIMEFINAD